MLSSSVISLIEFAILGSLTLVSLWCHLGVRDYFLYFLGAKLLGWRTSL